jgi:hypothetical protein
MILQLDPTIPLDTPRGPAYAHFLIEFARKYPEYAEALTDLAVDIALDTLRGDKEPAPIEAAMSPAVSRAMARFSNQLFAVRQSQGRR